MKPQPTDAWKLKENRKILKQLEKELADFQNYDKAIPDKYLTMFPTKTHEQVRETMIKARTADILNYEHIIADYESKIRGS